MVTLRDILRDLFLAVVFAAGAISAANFVFEVWNSFAAF
jgi:hypothetical protein